MSKRPKAFSNVLIEAAAAIAVEIISDSMRRRNNERRTLPHRK